MPRLGGVRSHLVPSGSRRVFGMTVVSPLEVIELYQLRLHNAGEAKAEGRNSTPPTRRPRLTLRRYALVVVLPRAAESIVPAAGEKYLGRN